MGSISGAQPPLVAFPKLMLRQLSLWVSVAPSAHLCPRAVAAPLLTREQTRIRRRRFQGFKLAAWRWFVGRIRDLEEATWRFRLIRVEAMSAAGAGPADAKALSGLLAGWPGEHGRSHTLPQINGQGCRHGLLSDPPTP